MNIETFYLVTTYVLFGVIGLCIGSFLNVVIYRLPRGMNLAKPASHCPTCNHQLKWYDNIPLISFIALKGKCRYCGTKITPRYLFVELTTAIFFVLCVTLFYEQGILCCIVNAITISCLIAIALCDAENMFIPDTLQIVYLILAVANVFVNLSTWSEKLIGLAVGGGLFILFYLMAYLLFKKEGLGLGDVKLMSIAGLFLGWKNIIVAIVVAVFSALIYITLQKIIACKKTKTKIDGEGEGLKEFPFAPYLVFGIIVAQLVGTIIFNAYLSLIGF